MKFSQRTVLFLATILLTLSYSHLMAWQTNGVAICTAVNNQLNPQIVSDDVGGSIITWEDYRNETNPVGRYSDIYAQRVNNNGSILWILNGIGISTEQGFQLSPIIVSDGASGAIISWVNGGGESIYAQRVNSNGTTLWTVGGIPIRTSTNTAHSIGIVADGLGGAILTWEDYRNGTIHSAIYVQRVNSNGSTLWTLNGLAICTTFLVNGDNSGAQYSPAIVSDGVGGAVITWQDGRDQFPGLYAQRINSIGSTLWTTSGIAICTTVNSNGSASQLGPSIVSDDSSGAIITWEDGRNGSTENIYAQRINSQGTPFWITDGVAITTVLWDISAPAITSDGSSGAIIGWVDYRNDDGSFSNTDIYTQRINSAGSTMWATNGIAICTANGIQSFPQIISDGLSGSIITWEDSRYSNGDIFCQHLNSNGSTLWTTNGLSICTTLASQGNPRMVNDGSGGAIIIWEDYRNGTYSDIYAQSVNGNGLVPIDDWFEYGWSLDIRNTLGILLNKSFNDR